MVRSWLGETGGFLSVSQLKDKILIHNIFWNYILDIAAAGAYLKDEM